jgi:hypothetical protein
VAPADDESSEEEGAAAAASGEKKKRKKKVAVPWTSFSSFHTPRQLFTFN